MEGSPLDGPPKRPAIFRARQEGRAAQIGGAPRFIRSAIVGLRADELQTAPGDPVGLATQRGDGPPPLQFPEQLHVEAGEPPAVAGVAMHFQRLARRVADEFDPPALGEQVEDALFSA